MRMLFFDHSYTIEPVMLILKLRSLGLNTSLWILDLLTGRPQMVLCTDPEQWNPSGLHTQSTPVRPVHA